MEKQRFLITFIFEMIFITQMFAYGEELSFPQKVQQWFEWGDYQSITESVPSVLAQDSQMPSDTQAYLHLYLGVAFFSDGEIGKARKEFAEAIVLMPTIMLDINYVNQEMYNLFVATIEEVANQQDLKKNNALLAEKNAQIRQENMAAIDSLDKTVSKVRNTGLVISALTMTGISLGLAGVAAYEYHAGDQEYQKFVQVSKQGDYLEYSRLKERVHTYDQRTVIAGVASAVFAIADVFLYRAIYVHHRHATESKRHRERLTIATGMNEVALLIHF